MIIDRGFFVDNYVGHYHMQDHKGEKYIVSEEQRFSQDDKHKLQKKRIFEFDNRDYEYIYMELRFLYKGIIINHNKNRANLH